MKNSKMEIKYRHIKISQIDKNRISVLTLSVVTENSGQERSSGCSGSDLLKPDLFV